MPAHLLPVSRRRFLAGAAASFAAPGQGRLSGDESSTDPDSWALLSDTHLLSASSLLDSLTMQNPDKPVMDCFLLTATPTAEEVSGLRRDGKQVLFNYAGSGEARRNIETWRRSAAAWIDGLLTDYPLEYRIVWRTARTSERQEE